MKETFIMEHGKKVTRANDKFKSFRLTQEELKAISAEARRLNCSESDYIRSAVNDKLLKNINDNNLIMEYLPKIMQTLKRNQESIELSNELFIYWLSYFFAYSPIFPNDEVKNKQTRIGEAVKKRMLDDFKNYKRVNNKSWLEQLIMEYFEFGSNEGGTIK